jgi:hypothetical protein
VFITNLRVRARQTALLEKQKFAFEINFSEERMKLRESLKDMLEEERSL